MRTKFKEQIGNEIVFFTPSVDGVCYNGSWGVFWQVEKTTIGSGVIRRCDNFFAYVSASRTQIVDKYIERILEEADQANMNASEQMGW